MQLAIRNPLLWMLDRDNIFLALVAYPLFTILRSLQLDVIFSEDLEHLGSFGCPDPATHSPKTVRVRAFC